MTVIERWPNTPKKRAVAAASASDMPLGQLNRDFPVPSEPSRLAVPLGMTPLSPPAQDFPKFGCTSGCDDIRVHCSYSIDVVAAPRIAARLIRFRRGEVSRIWTRARLASWRATENSTYQAIRVGGRKLICFHPRASFRQGLLQHARCAMRLRPPRAESHGSHRRSPNSPFRRRSRSRNTLISPRPR